MCAKWKKLWHFLAGLSATRCVRIALFIWVVYAGVIASIVAIDPSGRTATKEYQRATDNWWGEKTLYRKKNGYLYLPQFAIFYTPYEPLPDRVGEPLWRLTCLAALAWALWAVAFGLAPGKREIVFLIATVLILPSTFASARNGQVNMPLAALLLLGVLAVAKERWWSAAVLLALTLIFKPIALAPILLCGVLYPKLRIPLFVALLVTAILPFAHPNPAYALGEYQAFFYHLQHAGNPGGNSWCDFVGMLRVFGLELSSPWQLAIRTLAGLLTLGFCWRVVKGADAMRATFTVFFLATIYLMLFNPRTETNSYVILGGFVAIWAAVEGIIFQRFSLVAYLTGFAILLGSENYGWPVFPLTNLWAKALATSALAVFLIVRICQTIPIRQIMHSLRAGEFSLAVQIFLAPPRSAILMAE